MGDTHRRKNQNEERGPHNEISTFRKSCSDDAGACDAGWLQVEGGLQRSRRPSSRRLRQGRHSRLFRRTRTEMSTTTTVQPPAPGQTAQSVTTTVTPAAGVAANTPATAPVATGQPVTAGQTDASGQPVQAPAPGGDADCSACGCEYCCGNESDDSNQSAHQREDEPRGRPV